MRKNLFGKIIRCLDKMFPPLDREGKNCWGMQGGIDAMMESRQQVKEKEQWMARHLQKQALFKQLKGK